MINRTDEQLDFLTRLRMETSGIHKSLDGMELTNALLRPDLTREQYIKYLQTVYIMHKGVESFAHPRLTIVPQLEKRSKTQLISKDLLELNADLPEGDFLQESVSYDNSFLLGMLYVAEGSVLGGRVILKNVQQVGSIKCSHHFLNGYGAETGILWKSFLDFLTEYARINSSEQTQVIRGATYCFEQTRTLFASAAT